MTTEEKRERSVYIKERIYTGIFPTALYLYCQKENRTRSRNRVVIGTISSLYFVTALYALVNWIYTDSLLCAEGGTRAEIFLENVTQALPKGVSLLADITEFAGFVLADGLLVWRCFNACRGSRPRSILAVGLFIVETGLVVSGTIYQCLLDANPGFETNKRDRIFTRLIATMLVSVAATSLVATSMICWEIYVHSAPGSRSRKRYQSIINALIESSAIYTIAVLFMAALVFVGKGNQHTALKGRLMMEYVGAVVQIVAGLAPTLMVARLSSSSPCEEFEHNSTFSFSPNISSTLYSTGSADAGSTSY
ncbi:hypothetical protein D9613_012674 [Agrocybe pediades]|uniref:Uncharacterized protein n=1 Tax=Agrocybe pediades TaxID=84607 RepID=A0A8H4VS51_9AGAR|nr:hypothetical protein D9613_012674 [Agrocybe pediades]